MYTFKQFLDERKSSKVEGGSLYIFDIDDTLFRTTAMINVVKAGKTIRKLTNQQFNNYVLKNDEVFDFGEFKDAEKFNKESTPIPKMIDTLIRLHNKIKLNLTPGSDIIMNTARGDFDDEEMFHDTFKDQGIDIDRIPTHRAEKLPGAIPAEKKLVITRHYLDKKKYDAAFMYDDSKTNLTYFLKLKQEYPDTDFQAYLIDEDGEMNLYKP